MLPSDITGFTVQIPSSVPFFPALSSASAFGAFIQGSTCTTWAVAQPETQSTELIAVLAGFTVTCSYLAGQVQGFPCE